MDYGEGSDEAFLRRLWHDLYSDQLCSSDPPDPAPADRTDLGMPGKEASDHRVLDVAYYEDLAGRLYGLLIGLEDRLDREDARQLHHFIEVGEYGLALEDIAGRWLRTRSPSLARNAPTCWPGPAHGDG
jgi:hypothetical protein